MAVTSNTRIKFLPFRSPPNPSFPAGIWTGQMFVAGDASGGNSFMVLDIILLTEPFSALMFTLEQFLVNDSASVRLYLIEATGFEEHDPVGNRNVLLHFQTATGPEAATALRQDNMLKKPLFLGRADRTSGQDTRIRVISDNTNGIGYHAELFGYYWGPGAMNAPGGPQRPPGSLFGT